MISLAEINEIFRRGKHLACPAWYYDRSKRNDLDYNFMMICDSLSQFWPLCSFCKETVWWGTRFWLHSLSDKWQLQVLVLDRTGLSSTWSTHDIKTDPRPCTSRSTPRTSSRGLLPGLRISGIRLIMFLMQVLVLQDKLSLRPLGPACCTTFILWQRPLVPLQQ